MLNSSTRAMQWRKISSHDRAVLESLDAACKQEDGNEPVSNLIGDAISNAEANFPTLCGLAGDKIIAAGWVKPGLQRVNLGGRVHPDWRRQGVGEHLLSWAEEQALGMIQSRDPVQVIITNEALTPGADLLYMRHGYQQLFSEWMMVFDLEQPLSDSTSSSGLVCLAWSTETAPAFFQAYADSFRDRPGFPDPPLQEWIDGYDEEGFRPDLSQVIMEGSRPIGFITCDTQWTLGWVDQMGIVPGWRGKGLGKYLLTTALKNFRAAGYHEAGLHVNANNPTAASLYEKVGFRRRLQRARYQKWVR